jgi:hypothetical protein
MWTIRHCISPTRLTFFLNENLESQLKPVHGGLCCCCMTLPDLTAAQCLAKADEMERLANAGPPEIHDSYIKMASEWRKLAAQSAWHVGVLPASQNGRA